MKKAKKNIKSWREKGKNSQLKLAIFTILILVLLIIVGKFFSFLGSLKEPFNPDGEAQTKVQVWDGETPINLAILSGQPYILSVNPLEKEAVVIKIPEDLYLNLPLGFGKYPARSIYSLGQDEQPMIGARLLQDTLTYSLALPFDGYLIFENSKESFDSLASKWRGSPINSLASFFAAKTNLSALELYRLALSLQTVRSDKLKILDLGQSQITESLLLPDKSRALGLDQIKLDQFILSHFEDGKLIAEEKTIGIYNATIHSQLAERASRLIINLGGRVVFTSNSEIKLERSRLVGTDSYTFAKISSIFITPCMKSKQILETNCEGEVNLENSRADINLYLGEDYYNKFNR